MNIENNPDIIASLIKENPIFETILMNLADEHKRSTSMLIHELRNPLSLMKGTLQYMDSKYPEVKKLKYWDQLSELVLDMEHMMANASQLNTCNIVQKDNHNLIDLIENSINTFMHQAVQQNIDLSLHVEEGAELYFSSYSCDAGRIKQVMNNLIKNAFEATPQGNFINVKLSFLPKKDEALPKLSIQVCNNGLPISEDEINNIFLPFVTYKKGGTGVGLAVVKKIIELHYGTISVSSDEMLTCFTLLLPLPVLNEVHKGVSI